MLFQSLVKYFRLPVFLSACSSFLLLAAHAVCCLWPLFTSVAVAAGHSYFLGGLTPYFRYLQTGFLLYFGFKLLQGYLTRPKTGTRMAYAAGAGVALLGLLLAPKPPDALQEQTLHTLTNLRFHRTLYVQVLPGHSLSRLQQELAPLKGIRPQKLRLTDSTLVIPYHSGQTDKTTIVRFLERQGYSAVLLTDSPGR